MRERSKLGKHRPQRLRTRQRLALQLAPLRTQAMAPKAISADPHARLLTSSPIGLSQADTGGCLPANVIRHQCRPDKDSDKQQRAAIAAFAKAHGYVIVEEFYDAAVSGADPIDTRPGFAAMLKPIEGNGVKSIIVEIATKVRPRPDRAADRARLSEGARRDPDPSVGARLLHRRHADRRPGSASARRDCPVRKDLTGCQAQGGPRSQESGHGQMRRSL
jgi:resolvase-like protein